MFCLWHTRYSSGFDELEIMFSSSRSCMGSFLRDTVELTPFERSFRDLAAEAASHLQVRFAYVINEAPAGKVLSYDSLA